MYHLQELKTVNGRLEELESKMETGLGLVENKLSELRRRSEAQSTSVTNIRSLVDCHMEIIMGVRISLSM